MKDLPSQEDLMYAKAFKTEDEWNARNIFKYFYDSYSMGHTAIIWKIIREWGKSIFEFEKVEFPRTEVSKDTTIRGQRNLNDTPLLKIMFPLHIQKVIVTSLIWNCHSGGE